MFLKIKNLVMTSFPVLKTYYKKYRVWKKRQEFKGLTNEQIFTNIYNTNKWDTNNTSEETYYSGTGSYGEPAQEYVAFLNNFILKNNIASVTDIGCGNFAIGKQIVEQNPSLRYNACDVVKNVIEANKRTYGSALVQFQQLDATNEAWPAAELLTIRQVLQHLSNADVKEILSKSKAYKYVIITEHLLLEGTEKEFNKDKPSGPDIRLVDGSGLYIDKPPFNMNATKVLQCREDAYNNEAYVVSFLVENNL